MSTTSTSAAMATDSSTWTGSENIFTAETATATSTATDTAP